MLICYFVLEELKQIEILFGIKSCYFFVPPDKEPMIVDSRDENDLRKQFAEELEKEGVKRA